MQFEQFKPNKLSIIEIINDEKNQDYNDEDLFESIMT
jgi:hypothetical protein